jgi:hypothetical protein
MQGTAMQTAAQRGIDPGVDADLSDASRQSRSKARIETHQGLTETIQRGRGRAHRAISNVHVLFYLFHPRGPVNRSFFFIISKALACPSGCPQFPGTPTGLCAFQSETNEPIEPEMPPVAEYLRQQAATCMRLARATFDLTTAERLRFLAAELNAKADELEDHGEFEFPISHGNGFAGQTGPD